MSKILIEKSNFRMCGADISATLSDLKSVYPDINGLDFESDCSNLQYLLWILGWHTRVNIGETLFTLSRLPDGAKIDNEDPYMTLMYIANHMEDGVFITVNIDGEISTFTNNGCECEESNVEGKKCNAVLNVGVKKELWSNMFPDEKMPEPYVGAVDDYAGVLGKLLLEGAEIDTNEEYDVNCIITDIKELEELVPTAVIDSTTPKKRGRRSKSKL